MRIFFVSCRNELGSSTEFGPLSFYIWRRQDQVASTISAEDYFKSVGDRPLILVHGFRCHMDDLQPTMAGILEKISAHAQTDPQISSRAYTSITMFTWPAGLGFAPALMTWWSFIQARRRTTPAAERLHDLLNLYERYTPPKTRITLQGHSLGGAICTQTVRMRPLALDNTATFPQVYCVALAAAACPPEWLDRQTLLKVPRWRIAFAQTGDNVLAWLYWGVSGFKKALGQTGPIGFDYGADVQSLNLSPCRHSGQWKDYRYIPFFWPES